MFVPFFGVAVLLASTNSAVFFATKRSQRQSEAMIQRAMRLVELANRMQADIARGRLELYEHIAELRSPGKGHSERAIADAQADLSAAMAQYGALIRFADESAVWHGLMNDSLALEPARARVLDLSRQNRKIEAWAALFALEGRFGAIDHEVETLVRMNRERVENVVARAEAPRRRASIVFTSAFLGQVVLTLIAGVWTTRFVRRREEEVERHAEELDAFAGRVAHDLRGPLNTLSLAAEHIARRFGAEEKTVATVRRGVDRMRALIDDLLALSRIGASACDKTCDPAPIARQIGDDVAERLAADSVTLTLDVQPGWVRCSDGLLRQVLVNLVDNAAKYRRPEVRAKIELLGRLERDRYVLEVSDNGVGMADDEARHAFDPFYRAQRVRERQGTGLGLSIVKRVVDASGGTIAIDSKLGQGTTVRVGVPLA